jgi:succinate dehydrogenase / fumarate reductase cytochrome b subunit
MNGLSKALSSTVGTKFAVAVTGAILAAFVLGHMAGNLQIFLGPEAMNSYAASLQGMPGPLWVARLGLLAALIVHIAGNFKLRARNTAARPISYVGRQSIVSTVYSRTMMLSGLILLAFILYHLAHFTMGLVMPGYYSLTDAKGRHDVYSMVVLGFREPLVAIPYLIAMGLLFMHLVHGVASMFQSLGLRPPNWRDAVDGFGRLFAIAVVAGNVVIVIACLLGIIEPFQEVL